MRLITAAVEPRPASDRSLEDALDGVCAAPILARLDVPDFDNAAMDGYALRAADTADASSGSPRTLRIAGTVAAGDAPVARARAGEALEIMTGAALPADCDAVLPIERAIVDADGRQVSFSVAATPGQNVRRAGEDFRAGQPIVPANRRLGPEQLMACAAGGLDELCVRTPPRVAILTTGAELTGQGAPSGTGRIRDANGPYLRAMLPRCGATVASLAQSGDKPEAIERALTQAAARAEVVITTGGVSAGRFDAVPAAIAALGGAIHFHKVAIRPGKPLLFAQLANGSWLFGLPGNPMAVAVGLRFFVVPALRALLGLAPEAFCTAVTDGPIRKRPGPRFFAKARARVDAEGRLRVAVLPGQESFRILPLAQANCWAIVDEGLDSLAPGARVPVAGLYPDAWPSGDED